MRKIKDFILISILLGLGYLISSNRQSVFDVFSIVTVQLLPMSPYVNVSMVLFLMAYIHTFAFTISRILNIPTHSYLSYYKLIALLILLMVTEYVLLCTTLQHKGVEHGWVVHLMNEGQHFVFMLLAFVNWLGILVYDDRDYQLRR